MAVDSAISGITQSSSNYVSPKKENSAGNDLDKDAFLQLLVAQMQYQDPLNPGDSTEYMSQLAQYSSLEATMNISSTIEQGNGLNLVGKYAIMNTKDSAGNSTFVSGLVEYATVKNGEVLLSINDNYYPATDLDSVVDYDYYLFLQEQAKKAVEDADKTDDADNSEKLAESGATKTEEA